MSNIIFLEFYNKDKFPPGKWLHEPDFCKWEHSGLPCLVVRDMYLGIWKGYVGVDSSHPFYSKSVEDLLRDKNTLEIFFSVYGGISGTGHLTSQYKDNSKFLDKKSLSIYWWIGIETSHGGDLMPLLKLENHDPDMTKMLSSQTYKDFSFIRKETNKLSKYVSRVK